MGLFSKITKSIGGILGGGSSGGSKAAATNTTSNTTNIDNIIDMKPVATAIQSGNNALNMTIQSNNDALNKTIQSNNAALNKTLTQSNSMFAEISKQSTEGLNRLNAALTSLIRSEQEGNKLISGQITDGLKVVGVLGGIALAYAITPNKKGKK